MAKHDIYSIYDSKAEAFGRPFVCESSGVACRMVEGVVTRPSESPYYTNPEDFTLYVVGEWDENKGIVVGCNPSVIAPLIVIRDAAKNREAK